MLSTNVANEQLSNELNNIDDSENETNDEQPQAKADKANPFAPAQNLQVPPPLPPPASNTAMTNERLKRNNRDISPDDSPTTNDMNPKMRAIEEKNGENSDEHEADEDVNNDDEDGFEDHQNGNNEMPSNQNPPNHDELTITSMIKNNKKFNKLTQRQRKELAKLPNANSNPNVV
jgi:hypothetical protein